jgi:hypothetical protein
MNFYAGRSYMSRESVIKTHFDDWTHLISITGNSDMINDPLSIWYEAFETGALLERIAGQEEIEVLLQEIADDPEDHINKMTIKEAKDKQRELLEQVINIIMLKDRTH